MADATTSLRVYTGASAGTESAAQTGIDLVSVDNAVNSPTNRSDNPVASGTNSFEKWMRVKIEAANAHTLANFWVERTGDLPNGVTLKMGVADTPATPTAATSTVATKTMAEGQRYIFDANEYASGLTRYLVLQEQTASTASGGSIATESIEIGWSQS
jgi:hypothetical protein